MNSCTKGRGVLAEDLSEDKFLFSLGNSLSFSSITLLRVNENKINLFKKKYIPVLRNYLSVNDSYIFIFIIHSLQVLLLFNTF